MGLRADFDDSYQSRFLSNPLIITVPFFLIFSFNSGNPKRKRAKGYHLLRNLVVLLLLFVLFHASGGLLLP